jgi:hypothetical protein
MSSRLVISMVCVAAVAFACGPRTRSESATQSAAVTIASTTDARITQQGEARTTKDGALSATLYVRSNESPMRLALHVVNTSKKRLELTFPSGQTHDFVILDSVGREVWRWGNGRMFTQSLRNKLLGAGETLELEESVGRINLVPGKYVARAVLTSRNHPIAQEAEFTVHGGTFAAR